MQRIVLLETGGPNISDSGDRLSSLDVKRIAVQNRSTRKMSKDGQRQHDTAFSTASGEFTVGARFRFNDDPSIIYTVAEVEKVGVNSIIIKGDQKNAGG